MEQSKVLRADRVNLGISFWTKGLFLGLVYDIRNFGTFLDENSPITGANVLLKNDCPATLGSLSSDTIDTGVVEYCTVRPANCAQRESSDSDFSFFFLFNFHAAKHSRTGLTPSTRVHTGLSPLVLYNKKWRTDWQAKRVFFEGMKKF